MLLLLPPSEGKSVPSEGSPPVELGTLTAAAELTPRRDTMLAALAEASRRQDATDLLKVGQSLTAEVAANTTLRMAPAGRAGEVYSGVLYAAAGLASLEGLAAERAQRAVRIFSALWGVVAPGDRIPAYRFSMAVDLPGLGRTAAGWRAPLAAALDARAANEVVVDCRSAPYQAAWKPPKGTDLVAVRVVREIAGRRTVVSHNAKHTRGVLVGHLLRRPEPAPSDAAGVLAAANELVGTVVGTQVGSGLSYRLLAAELSAPAAGHRTLELVID